MNLPRSPTAFSIHECVPYNVHSSTVAGPVSGCDSEILVHLVNLDMDRSRAIAGVSCAVAPCAGRCRRSITRVVTVSRGGSVRDTREDSGLYLYKRPGRWEAWRAVRVLQSEPVARGLAAAVEGGGWSRERVASAP